MPVTLKELPTVSVGDTEMVAVDCQDWLDSSELLTGTPTVTEVGSADLTISNVAVNTVALTVKSRSVAIGEAVQCKVTGFVDDTQYRLRITTTTNSSPARTKVFDVRMIVV